MSHVTFVAFESSEESDDAPSSAGGGGAAFALPFPGPLSAEPGDAGDKRSCRPAAPCDVPASAGVGGSITSMPLLASGSYTRHYSMTNSYSVRAAYEVLTFTLVASADRVGVFPSSITSRLPVSLTSSVAVTSGVDCSMGVC